MINCPKCHHPIASEQINIQADIAQCLDCPHVFKISEQFDHSSQPRPSAQSTFDIQQTPSGTWYRQDVQTTIIGATTRSAQGFFLVPFICVWSGFALSGIYGTQIANQEFDLFQSLFGIPFILGTLFFGWQALMSVFGKVEIRFDRYEAKVFTGIGGIGRTKHFQWQNVTNIWEGQSDARRNKQIILDGQPALAFGEQLSFERCHYLIQALRKFHNQYQRR